MVQMEEDQANICLLKESLDKTSQKVSRAGGDGLLRSELYIL